MTLGPLMLDIAGTELTTEDRELIAALDQTLREMVAAEPGQVEEVELDEAAIERLRALGYVR